MNRMSGRLLAIAVLFALLLPVAPGCGESPGFDVSGSALNTTPMKGPEGIALAPDGSAYIGEHDGRIRRIAPDGQVEEFADLKSFSEEPEAESGAIGLAMDDEGDIYFAAISAFGGSVFKAVGPGKPDAGKVSMFRKGVTSANFILIDDETGTLYATNSSMLSGSVYRFDMNDESLVGSTVDVEKDLLGEFGYANGLALGPEKKWLYVAETLKGRVSRIDLETGESEVFAKVGGWADGLLYDPERELMFVADNKGGRIVAVDLSGAVAGEIRLVGKEGQVAPACMAFRDSNTILVTDLWKASMLDALLGRAKYHSYVYEVPVDKILN